MRILKFLYIMFLSVALVACGSDAPRLKPLASGAVIVAFGDSLTAGTGTDKSQSYPAYLARITHRQVVNAGVPGEETAGGLKRIAGVLKAHHPGLVILCLGGNDMLHKRNPAEIKDNLASIISVILDSGAEVMLLAVPKPSISLSVPDFYGELGEEFGIPVDENSLSDLLSQPDKKSDYIHLNAAGYKELAESIARQLKEAGAL